MPYRAKSVTGQIGLGTGSKPFPWWLGRPVQTPGHGRLLGGISGRRVPVALLDDIGVILESGVPG